MMQKQVASMMADGQVVSQAPLFVHDHLFGFGPRQHFVLSQMTTFVTVTGLSVFSPLKFHMR